MTCGFPKLGTGANLGLQAARSYSLISPPRTGRRLIRWWSRRGAGEVAALDVAYGHCSGGVPGKDVPQVPLAEYQDAVSELASNGQDEAFGEAVRSRLSG
jgi:hypothetical protein